MTGNIIAGIAGAIDAVYPDSSIYNERVEQDLQAGDFIIRLMELQQQDMTMSGYRRIYPMEIVYFAAAADRYTDIYNKADKLMRAVKYIDVPEIGTLTGTNISMGIVDDVLHVYVYYRIMSASVSTEDKIEVLETEVHIGNEEETGN